MKTVRIAAIPLLAVVLLASNARAADGGVVCPSSVPIDGAACSGSGGCEYGADVHGLCTTFASCNLGAWKVTPPSPSCDTSAPDCPSSFSTLGSGVICPLADKQSLCIYDEGICACPHTCLGANSVIEPQWLCHAWSEAQPGCPAIRPPAGSACTLEGQLCSWEGCCGGMPLGPDELCSGGVWTLHVTNSCACGGTLQACTFAPVTTDAGSSASDAGADVGAEPEEVIASGCSCRVAKPTSPTPPLAFALVFAALAFVRRANRAAATLCLRWREPTRSNASPRGA